MTQQYSSNLVGLVKSSILIYQGFVYKKASRMHIVLGVDVHKKRTELELKRDKANFEILM